MSTIRVSGDTSGYFDLTVPSAAGTNTIDLSKLPVKDASNNLVLNGNLTIDGSLTFEGSSADDHETTLTVTNPTADRTVTIPNVTGTLLTTGLNTSDAGSYEGWNATTGNGHTKTWQRRPLGNNLYLWVMSGDSVHTASPINMPSGTGNNGTTLGVWTTWTGSVNGTGIIFQFCQALRRYSWHAGDTPDDGADGFTYVNNGSSAEITQYKHNLGTSDRISNFCYLSHGQ